MVIATANTKPPEECVDGVDRLKASRGFIIVTHRVAFFVFILKNVRICLDEQTRGFKCLKITKDHLNQRSFLMSLKQRLGVK